MQLTKKFPCGGTFSLGVLTEPSAAGCCLNIFLAKAFFLICIFLFEKVMHGAYRPEEVSKGTITHWLVSTSYLQQLTIFVFER